MTDAERGRRGPETREKRVAQLFGAVHRWHQVAVLARLRGEAANADDAIRVERRILCVAGLLRNPSYRAQIPDSFISKRKSLSASEFVHDVEERLGSLPGKDLEAPAVVKARQRR